MCLRQCRPRPRPSRNDVLTMFDNRTRASPKHSRSSRAHTQPRTHLPTHLHLHLNQHLHLHLYSHLQLHLHLDSASSYDVDAAIKENSWTFNFHSLAITSFKQHFNKTPSLKLIELKLIEIKQDSSNKTQSNSIKLPHAHTASPYLCVTRLLCTP